MRLDSGDLQAYILRHNISAEIVHLPVDTPTVEAAAAAVGSRPEQIAKSLLFLKEGQPLLVIGHGLGRVDYRRLAGWLGVSRKKIQLAGGARVEAITGYAAGSVPPFGHLKPLRTLVAAGVLALSELYAGGGAINALLRIAPQELVRASAAELVEL